MDFVPGYVSDFDSSLIYIFFALAVAFVIISILVKSAKLELCFAIAAVPPFLVAIVLMGIGTSDMSASRSYANNERPELVANQISQTYGIDIPTDQIRHIYLDDSPAGNLRYPSSLPESDFVRYGTIIDSKVEDGLMIERKITLAWIDGEFRLYGLDENEEVGPELPRMNEAKR